MCIYILRGGEGGERNSLEKERERGRERALEGFKKVKERKDIPLCLK